MRSHAELLTLGAICLLTACGTSSSEPVDAGHDGDRDANAPSTRLLVFTRTAGFRHDSISDGVGMLRHTSAAHDWVLDETEDPTVFNPANLSQYAAVVWLSTTGDVLDEAEQVAFEEYVRAGGAFVGIHAAADCEYDWPWYAELVGAYFDSHPSIQSATVRVEAQQHPIAAGLPDSWMRNDEWYNFRTNPRSDVSVILTVDESTYEGGTMGADHPIAWAHDVDAGRSFYIALGHTSESYTEPEFITLVDNALVWAISR